MVTLADVVSPGGPSGPVWAFLTGISLAVLAIIGQQLKAKSDLKQMKHSSEAAQSEATKAHKSAAQAQENTANVANGFARTVLGKLDRMYESQQETQKAVREHLQWHLEHLERREE